MITLIIALVIIALIASICGMGSDAKRTRESQERVERIALSQMPPPAGFDDCSPDVVLAVRESNRLGAIAAYMRQHKCEVEKAALRIDILQEALRQGPAIGRPRSGLFG